MSLSTLKNNKRKQPYQNGFAKCADSERQAAEQADAKRVKRDELATELAKVKIAETKAKAKGTYTGWRYLHEIAQPGQTIIDVLPNEVITNIFDCFVKADYKTLINLRRSCRLFSQFVLPTDERLIRGIAEAVVAEQREKQKQAQLPAGYSYCPSCGFVRLPRHSCEEEAVCWCPNQY